MEEEYWKAVPKYEGLYEASNLGRIRSLDRYITCSNGAVQKFHGKILKSDLGNNGYLNVCLCKSAKLHSRTVHRIIAETFLENDDPEHKTDVNHKDGVKTNNNIKNLEWCTRSYNVKHSYDHGLHVISDKQIERVKDKLGHSVYCIDNNKVYRSETECAKDLKISVDQVLASVRRGGEISNIGNHGHRYRIILSSKKDDFVEDKPNNSKLFENQRIAKLYKTGETFRRITDFCKAYGFDYQNISRSINNYYGYIDQLDDVLYDCVYDENYTIPYDDYHKILYNGRRKSFKAVSRKAIRCSDGTVYISAIAASRNFGVCDTTVAEVISRSGYCKKVNRRFEYVDMYDISDDEVDALLPAYQEKRKSLREGRKYNV